MGQGRTQVPGAQLLRRLHSTPGKQVLRCLPTRGLAADAHSDSLEVLLPLLLDQDKVVCEVSALSAKPELWHQLRELFPELDAELWMGGRAPEPLPPVRTQWCRLEGSACAWAIRLLPLESRFRKYCQRCCAQAGESTFMLYSRSGRAHLLRPRFRAAFAEEDATLLASALHFEPESIGVLCTLLDECVGSLFADWVELELEQKKE